MDNLSELLLSKVEELAKSIPSQDALRAEHKLMLDALRADCAEYKTEIDALRVERTNYKTEVDALRIENQALCQKDMQRREKLQEIDEELRETNNKYRCGGS